MPYEKTGHEAIVYFEVTGEADVPSLAGPDDMMQPIRVRLFYFGGQLSNIWVFGHRRNKAGKPLKSVHCRSYSFDAPGERDDISHPDSPVWLKKLVEQMGYTL